MIKRHRFRAVLYIGVLRSSLCVYDYVQTLFHHRSYNISPHTDGSSDDTFVVVS